MKERPILMHASSINGILEGRKTQTRRIIKREWWRCLDDENEDDRNRALSMCPYGVLADRLWVRETWAMNDVKYGWGKIPKNRPIGFGEITYRADGEWKDQFEELDGDIPPWRPSIFMPRWASRLTLEIIGIRVERVQDISEEDAKAEGVSWELRKKWWQGYDNRQSEGGIEWHHTQFRGDAPPEWMIEPHPCVNPDMDPLERNPIREFQGLWDDTNGKGAWQRNDWCWVIDFRRVQP